MNMRKALHILSFAAVAIAALTSCAKEELNENAIPAGEKIEVSLSGQIGEFTPADATKATAESVVRVTWGSGDNVFVYDGSNASIGTLTVTPDNNNASYAMLSGTITASAASPAPTKLTLVYVKGATEAPAISGGKISVDLSSQNQAEVPFVLYTTVAYDADALTKTDEYISFSFATSVMTVNCTGLQTGASGAVAGIDRAEIDGVSTACELTIDGSGVTAVAGTTPGTITRTGTSVFQQSDSRGSFRLALAADPAAPAARNILVHQGNKVSGSPFTSATLAAGMSYNTVYQMGEYISNEPDGKLSGGFTVDAQGKKVYFSKGNLQATYNGSSYAWDFAANQYSCVGNAAGNTSIDSQTNDAVVDLFGWSTDANNNNWGIHTKTVATQDYTTGGFKDWGKAYCASKSITPDNTWRTLSTDEWKYLFNKDNTYGANNRSGKYKYGVTVCGKENCVVLLPDNWDETVISLTNFAALNTCDESSNPKWSEMQAAGAVCLPAAGYRDGSDVNSVGVRGIYWSSTAYDGGNAYGVFFDSYGVDPDFYDFRGHGYSVRLVTESSGGYSPAVKVTGVSLNKTKTTIEAGATERLEAAVAPADATNKQINWLSSNTSVATVDAASGEVTGVAPGSAVITATTADGNFTAVCLVTVKPLPPTTGTAKRTDNIDVNWVQLWKDGPKFAEYNVGVSGDSPKPEDYGGYYAWGGNQDVQGVASPTYNTGTSPLTGDDDTATKLWGSNWRIPTKAELDALINATNCTVEWANVGGVNGRKFTGKGAYASNSVFLPAAGYCSCGDVLDQGNHGYYWSSAPSGSYYAYYLSFTSGYQLVDDGSRGRGVSVRAVLAE